MNIKKSLTLLSSNKSIQMDTILINNKLSVNISGIGFDGHVAGLFGKNGKRGLVGYIKLVAREFLSFKEFDVKLVADDTEFDRPVFILAIANSSQFGNNATISPYASVCDQLMDVCFMRKVPLIQSLGFAKKMFTQKINSSSFVEVIQARKISVRFPKPMPYHIDGEAMNPESQFTIELMPASLNVIVPANPDLIY